jgi:hypothetical protein
MYESGDTVHDNDNCKIQLNVDAMEVKLWKLGWDPLKEP